MNLRIAILVLALEGVHGRLRISAANVGGREGVARMASSDWSNGLDEQARQCTSAIQRTDTKNPPSMRLHSPRLCDPDVRQQSGYLDLPDTDAHVFFWYFGSRTRLSPDFSNTTTVPLVFWFSGGPGCSSQIANWQENGPCQWVPSVDYDKELDDTKRKQLPHGVQRNPWAWNDVADLVFIDQPVGTGFSYGAIPSSTEAAADTAWRAMQAVHTLLNEERMTRGEQTVREVFLFGESYGGRYIPVFTEYLLHMNDLISGSPDLQARGFATLPLAGVGIGNGLFDYMVQAPTYHKMGCDSTYSPPLFNPLQCKYLEKVVNPLCIKALDTCYSGTTKTSVDTLRGSNATCVSLVPEPWRSSQACAYADRYCNGALNWTTLANTYDVREGARSPPDDYVDYLRTSEFAAAVGANPDIVYTECSDPVFDRFASTSDEVSRSAMASMEFILDRGVPLLLYTGDADFICNWYGTMLVARALQWHGNVAFRNNAPVAWTYPEEFSGTPIEGGQLWTAENLSFLRVYQAGHEVPYYQPQASLHMLAQFLSHQKL
ncbi:hypothetical protein EV175_005854 [Coemansia sp. RSA 1933]|nr:hypothetical protein EV175_005854 [Coemansia sp. RSA 1933]